MVLCSNKTEAFNSMTSVTSSVITSSENRSSEMDDVNMLLRSLGIEEMGVNSGDVEDNEVSRFIGCCGDRE